MASGFIKALAQWNPMRVSQRLSRLFSAAGMTGDNARALPLESFAVVFNLGLGHNSRSASLGWTLNINL